jgi:hypothetical protein
MMVKELRAPFLQDGDAAVLMFFIDLSRQEQSAKSLGVPYIERLGCRHPDAEREQGP